MSKSHMLGRLFSCRRLPWVLGVGAVLFMLPALWSDLLVDDLIQRPTQFKPEQLPARLLETGFVPEHSGELGTVLWGLFGYGKTKEARQRAKDYGIAPWWTHPGWRAALFRPVSALTHWVDYQLFPNTPALMHAHSILWYAAAVWLVTAAYRKVAKIGLPEAAAAQAGSREHRFPAESLLATGIAGTLFLLDPRTYLPVLYVANRGFMIALVFGLLCFHAHLEWRRTKRAGWMWLSSLCLLLALLANEGGVSTLALLMAYALLLEGGGWRRRLLTLGPAAVVVLAWRAVYAGFGFGVRNFTLYIDPGYEPLLFLKHLVPRTNALLGGQLSGIPPEIALALNSTWRMLLALGFAIFCVLCAIVFMPLLRRERSAQFWATVMVLAAVPAATVYPLTKNMAFIAVGAFGVTGAFLVWLFRAARAKSTPGWFTAVSGFTALWLCGAHVAAALSAKIGLGAVSPHIPAAMAQACSFGGASDLRDREVVVINDPTLTSFVVPFDRAYRGLPLPRSIRNLVPGTCPIQVHRADAWTLVISARNADLFDCPKQSRPVHITYAMKSANAMLLGPKSWTCGQRVTCRGFVAEVLELSATGLPSSVAFHFAKPLESEEMVWFYFDWSRFRHSDFVVPGIGQTVQVAGAETRRQ